jgi:hypothetical protein
MARRKVNTSPAVETKFSRVYEMDYGNFTIEKGDLIKIQGVYGIKFKFISITTNTETGSFWVDCVETYRGQSGPLRSFTVDRVRRIPKKRGKRVKKSE